MNAGTTLLYINSQYYFTSYKPGWDDGEIVAYRNFKSRVPTGRSYFPLCDFTLIVFNA